MEQFIRGAAVSVPENLYLKDPLSSNLGKRIVRHGIELISEIGVDQFTFRKLGERIGSNESSLYRYFENKHKFLIYLCSWYWGWLEYRLVLAVHNLQDPEERLYRALQVLTRPVEVDHAFAHIDEVQLHQIVVNEHTKPFLTQEVDRQNKAGYFEVYKRLIRRFAGVIRSVNPEYPFANSLASTVLEGSLHHFFLEQHFPTLTDTDTKGDHTEFFRHLVCSGLEIKPSVA